MGVLDGDTLAALGAARIDDGAAAGRFHAHTKAVRLLSMGVRWLESALHLMLSSGRNRPTAKSLKL
jgi:hypothetical protein